MLNPDITTLSLLLRDGDVDIKADIPLLSFLTKTTFSKVSTVVLIDVMSLPFILSTETLNPPPWVPVLSNVAESPIL